MQTIADPVAALRVDTSTTTASVTPLSADADMLSDEATIATAVGLAQRGSPNPWSNSATGAAGVISSFSESSAEGRTCRDFETSRHGFDGIALYRGRTCRTSQGSWLMQNFDRADG